jgi:hypothetical protein
MVAALRNLLTKTKLIAGPLAGLALVGIATCVWIEFSPSRVAIDVQRTTPAGGHAYWAPIAVSESSWIRVIPDSSARPRESRLQLFEDGRPLGPAHSQHADIRAKGRGLYSHWGEGVYFSSSDDFDPRENRRNYSALVYGSPSEGLLFGSIVLLALSGLLRRGIDDKSANPMSTSELSPPPWRALIDLPGHALRLFSEPRPMGRGRLATIALALLAIGGSWLWLAYLWNAGRTIDLAIASVFQVSDAGGWSQCSMNLLDTGRVSAMAQPWCFRRPIYPSFLATLFALTNRHWMPTLFLQAALVSTALFVLARSTTRWVGIVGGLATLCWAFFYAMHNAFPLTASENAGLAFGAIGLAFLTDGARLRSRPLLFWGTACLSIGLSARAGAFLALLALAGWGIGEACRDRKWGIRAAIAIFAGIAAGFVVHAAISYVFDGPSGQGQSNFSYVLYGLSVGGKTWSHIYKDHPEIFNVGLEDPALARLIYGFAIDNILAKPSVFLSALQSNLLLYLGDPMFDLPGSARFGYPSFFWWVGAVAIVFKFRDQTFRLIGLLSIGVALSTAFIIQEGGDRVLATTIPLTAVQAAIGIALTLRALAWLLPGTARATYASPLKPANWEIVFSLGIFAAVILPLTPFRALTAPEIFESKGCEVGEIEAIARLGRETQFLTILPSGSAASPLHFQVSYDTLIRGMPEKWFKDSFAALTPPISIIHGYQLAENLIAGTGKDVRLLSREDLGWAAGRSVRFCFDADTSVEIAGLKYFNARFMDLAK